MTTMGMRSLPLAVSVSRNVVARAELTPIASAAFGGIIVAVAPVSSARRTRQLPLGPLSRTYTMRRPASERSGYSGTEGDGVTLRQGGVRVEDDGQPMRFDESVVDIIPMGGMGDQPSAQRFLRAGVHAIHRNEQPLTMEPFSDACNGLTLHHRITSLAPNTRFSKGRIW